MNAFTRTIRSWKYRLKYPDYRLIADSHLFDPLFYATKYPDIAASGVDPLLHYIQAGYAEPRQPHPCFDVGYYYSQLPALRDSGQNPLVHYLTEGWRQGIKPNYLFCPQQYMAENADVNFGRREPLGHYLTRGEAAGRRPHPYFDPLYYRRVHPDIDLTAISPFGHYIASGLLERRRPSLEFDMAWYGDRTPVDEDMHRDLFRHYQDFGAAERKSPSPLFDPRFYEETYGLHDEKDLFRHYLLHGLDDTIKPCPWFDPAFYRRQYLGQDSRKGFVKIGERWLKKGGGGFNAAVFPFADFLSRGIHQGHYPNGEVSALAEKPLISIIVPVYNPTIAHLNNCIRSLIYQSYPHWQLCLADDGSSADHVRPALSAWAEQDPRIKIVFLEKNLGISGATNAAAALAEGEYLGFLDNDDELANDCLFRLVAEINRSGADLLYTDEDLIGEDGRCFSVFAKPDYNEELLFTHNYITHMVLCRRQLYTEVGGCRPAMDGAQDYDLFLRLSERATKIAHIAEVLYHWRAAATSTSIHHEQKGYADAAGRLALTEACERRDLAAEILPTDWKFYYRLRRLQADQPLVAIIVHWLRPAEQLTTWLDMLFGRAGYRNFQLVVFVTDQAGLAAIEAYQAGTDQPIIGRLVATDTSLADIIKAGSRESEGELLALVGSRLMELGPDWLAALVEYGLAPGVGAVGGRIEVTEGEPAITPVPMLNDTNPHYYAGFIQDCSVLLNGRPCAQQVRSVSADLCLVPRHQLARAGGPEGEVFANLFVLHDLCYRLHHLGLKNIYTPYATGRISPGRGQEPTAADFLEKEAFQRKWQELLAAGDPFFSVYKLRAHQIAEDQFRAWLLGE